MSKPNRNDPCPCGSGKKYKKCCGAKEAPQKTFSANPSMEVAKHVTSALLSLRSRLSEALAEQTKKEQALDTADGSSASESLEQKTESLSDKSP